MHRTSILGLNLTKSESLRLFVFLGLGPWILFCAGTWVAVRLGWVDPPANAYFWVLVCVGATTVATGLAQGIADARSLLGRPATDDNRTRLWAEIRTDQSLLQSSLQQEMVRQQTTQTGLQTAMVDKLSSLNDFIARPHDRPDALFHDVPARPSYFFGRDQIVADLVAQLTTGGTVALSAEGLPGVGKTTLAVALAHHRTILDHFTDGVLWAGLGTQPDLLGILAGWGDALGVDVTDRPTTEGRAGAVHNAIGQRRLLLVIDDAWTPDAAKALRLGGPGCAHLLTTRDQAIARSFGTVQSVEVLDSAPARQLLADLAPITAQPTPDGPDLVAQLLAAVGYLPLAISSAHRCRSLHPNFQFSNSHVYYFHVTHPPPRRPHHGPHSQPRSGRLRYRTGTHGFGQNHMVPL